MPPGESERIAQTLSHLLADSCGRKFGEADGELLLNLRGHVPAEPAGNAVERPAWGQRGAQPVVTSKASVVQSLSNSSFNHVVSSSAEGACADARLWSIMCIPSHASAPIQMGTGACTRYT